MKEGLIVMFDYILLFRRKFVVVVVVVFVVCVLVLVFVGLVIGVVIEWI